MTTFERQVRIIHALREENRLLRLRLEAEQQEKRNSRCGFCGVPTRSGVKVCPAHRDLVE